MSSLIVEVCEIENIETHPNADLLEICTVKGWKVCASKGEFQLKEKVIFFPPDSVLPPSISNASTDDPPGRLGINKYLTKGHGITGIVRAARLRGFQSYGVLMKIDKEKGDLDWNVGEDVKDFFGIKKYEVPETCLDGDAEKFSPLLYRYTNIEHFANYPNVISPDEEIIITEKGHGKNIRLGFIVEPNENGERTWKFTAGSHGVRRKEFDANGKISIFWKYFSDNMKNLLIHIKDNLEFKEEKRSIILFGELIGTQDMKYGLSSEKILLFDISVNDKYLDFDIKQELFNKFNLESVPVLYKGKFNKNIIEELTSGDTTICDPSKAGKFKGREGIVISLFKERIDNDMILTATNGRVILKSISVDYLSRKNGTEFH